MNKLAMNKPATPGGTGSVNDYRACSSEHPHRRCTFGCPKNTDRITINCLNTLEHHFVKQNLATRPPYIGLPPAFLPRNSARSCRFPASFRPDSQLIVG